jgi:hypothetical protein
MTPFKLGMCMLAAAAIVGAPGLVPEAKAKSSDTAAAIAGGIVGLGVGAALAKSQKHNTTIYVPGYVPPYPPGGYDPYWGQIFKPAPEINCYPAQRACYNINGGYSKRWTWRIYQR